MEDAPSSFVIPGGMVCRPRLLTKAPPDDGTVVLVDVRNSIRLMK